MKFVSRESQCFPQCFSNVAGIWRETVSLLDVMSSDRGLANEWVRCSGENASYITITLINWYTLHSNNTFYSGFKVYF